MTTTESIITETIIEPEETASWMRPFDGDLGQLLGEFAWQYDEDAVADLVSETDPMTGCRYLSADQDDEIDKETLDGCMWECDTLSIGHVLEWANLHRLSPADGSCATEVDEEAVLAALTETSDDGALAWKPLAGWQVAGILWDHEILGTGDESCFCCPSAEEMLDDPAAACDLAAWADATSWSRAEEHAEEIASAVLDENEAFKPITRHEVREIIDAICAD